MNRQIHDIFTILQTSDMKAIFGLILGSLIQYSHSTNKGRRIFIVILGSSILVSLFILDPLMQIYLPDLDERIKVAIFSCSALISVELINLFVILAPSVIKKRIIMLLGVSEDKKVKEIKNGK